MSKRLTEAEYLEVIEWLEDHWPGTTTYRSADRLYADFAGYEAEHVWSAARRLFAEGSQSAPSPSKLLARMIEVAGGTGYVESGPHEHRWGHAAPTQLYGGVFATRRGPGERRCVIPECGQIARCSCRDECQGDPLYEPTERAATTAEIESVRRDGLPPRRDVGRSEEVGAW